MSIGVGVGDFIKILELIHQARKRFVDAPSQYDAISKDLKNFHNVILDIDILSSEWELDIKQRRTLQKVTDDSTCLLNSLLAKLDKFRAIGSSSTGMVQHAKKAWTRLNWSNGDVQEFRTQLSLNLELLGAAWRQIYSQRFSKLELKTDHVTERVDQQHLHEILDWFGPSDNGSRQSSLLDQHEEGTCEWFLTSAEFQDWIKSQDGLLFCPGLPGAGKTFLVSIVIRHLQSLFSNDGNTGIAYHYCDFRHQDSETINLILSGILKQLAQCHESLPEAMRTLHTTHKKRDTRPSLKEIKGTLNTVACLTSRTFIVIDGLDECLVWRELMTELRSLQGVNILPTSRVIPEISNDKGLEGSTVLEVHVRETDIRKYLAKTLPKLGRFVVNNEQLQEDVYKAIPGASGGMFLLARLHLDSLQGLMFVKRLKDALSTLPTGASAYDKAYQCALQRIESQHEHRVAVAKDVLAWLTFVKRPLTIEELRTAVIIQEADLDIDEDSLMDIEDMVSVCAGLVAVDEQNGKVNLIHYTTKEYLRRTWPVWANTHLKFLNADMAIATTCLTYLLFPVFDVDFSEMDRLSQSKKIGTQVFPLLEYSLSHGALHARVASANCPSIDRLRSSDSKVSRNWLLLNAKYGEGQGEGTAEWLIEQCVTASVRDSEGRTAFHYAVLNGWADSVECLLKGGAIMDFDVKNMTPFHYAVSTGNEAIVKVFLGAGVPVDLPVTRQLHTSPCQENKAIYVTKNNEKIVLGNSCSEQGLTPLHLAAITGSQNMTKFLLDHGANPNFPSHSGETPLHLAMKEDLYGPRWMDFWNDPDNRVECVLGWIDPEEDEDNYYSTKAWIRKERSAIIELLLDNPKTDINAQDIFGISPLHIAAGRKDLTAMVFQMLIDRGADISLCTTESRTPLHLAIMSKNVIAVSYLLKIGADPRAEDANGLNTLHYAAQARHLQILQNLLATIPDIQMEAFLNRQDKKGKNALHHLLRKHGVEIPVTRYLLERCNGINDLDSAGMSPVALYISANVLFSRQDDKHLLDLLFSYGADPSFKTTEGLGLVHLVGTSRRCSVGVLQTLAKWGIDLRSLDTQGRTVLHHSSITGTLVEDVLHFLCHDIELAVGCRDVHGKTALDYALEEKQKEHSPDLFDPSPWIRAEKLLRGVKIQV